MAAIDFEAEGLLDGLDGEAARGAPQAPRRAGRDGVSLDELRVAVEEDRLALLPVERVLSGGEERLTAHEVAERAGVDEDFLERQWRALGLALADDDAAVYTERDVEAAERVRELRDAGVPDDGILEVGRLLGMTMSQLAAANRRLIADAFMRAGDTEYDVAHALRRGRPGIPAADRRLAPVRARPAPARADPPRRLRRRRAVQRAGRRSRRASRSASPTWSASPSSARRLDPEALGTVTGRLGELAAAAVEPPVRLVKLIGDAAMLVGPEPAPVLEAALELVEAARRTRATSFPLLRAGVACGDGAPARRRLVRAPGEPGEPDHRDRPARQRARRARGSSRRSPTTTPGRSRARAG